MSTIIPIQELDTSTSPPRHGKIHAVVTLIWPYSSSTRHCALLLSERDFRLRAKGGQIRVKFSGLAARVVAEGRLGIGNEVELELGTGQWVRDDSGVAVHVPGKSVGELQFGRGVQLKVQKAGLEEAVEINVAEDAVDNVEQEQEQEQYKEKEQSISHATPAKRTSPATNFRSSIGSNPGSAAIYSSPAYVRRAAKFSYLDGLSRLFEDDDWDNQDFPRKKARTSLGEVRNWRVVDRTPSPERQSPEPAAQVDQEMEEAGITEAADGEQDSTNWADLNEPRDSQEVTSVAIPSVSGPVQQETRVRSVSKASDSNLSPLKLLATSALETRPSTDLQASNSNDVPPFPQLRLPSASPTPQPSEPERATTQSKDNPVTPRLLPLSSTALPSTTPQISPLATKLGSETQGDVGPTSSIDEMSRSVELPDTREEDNADVDLTPKRATDGLLEQIQFAPSESESAIGTTADGAVGDIMTSERSLDVDALAQPSINDLAEEDAFSSDEEADERLSAQEHDDEMMQEDDAGDVFDTAALNAEDLSGDETTEDREMHEIHAQGHQWIDESTTEKDTDLEDEVSLREDLNSQIAMQPPSPASARTLSQQFGFAPARALLHATETPVKGVSIAPEDMSAKTPLPKPQLVPDNAVSSAEKATPAAKPESTPKKTPQSAHDKVMKRTFSSLFGIKGTPSPEKEDAIPNHDGAGDVKIAVEKRQEDAIGMDRPFSAPEKDQQSRRVMETVKAFGNIPAPVNLQDQRLQQEAEVDALDAQRSLLKDTDKSESQTEEPSALQAIPTPVQQPAELIDLDSTSEEEDIVEEAPHDKTPSGLSKDAATPQRRTLTQSAEAYMATEDEHEYALDDGARENTRPDAITETIIVDAYEASAEHQVTEIQRGEPSSPARHLTALKHEHPNVVGQSDSAAPSEPVIDAESIVPNENQHAPTSMESGPSPLAEAVVSPLIDSGLHDKAQSESLGIFEGLEDIPGQLYDTDMQMDGHETLLQSPQPTRPLPSQIATNARPASAILKQSMPVDGGVHVQDHQEEQDAEMIDDDQEMPEPSPVSFRSQIGENDLQLPVLNRPEASSRPTSRDTIEDFSPVVLGSMAQRVGNTVSDESAVERLQELESQEDAAVNMDDQEGHPVPSIVRSAEAQEERELTPTPAVMRSEALELLSSPSGLLGFSPVRVTRSMSRKLSASQSTSHENEAPDTVRKLRAVVISEQPDALSENSNVQGKEEIEDQLQTPDMTAGSTLEATHKISFGESFQRTLSEEVVEPADLTLPLSPSATHVQAGEPAAQVSHANIAQAAMQPTPFPTQSHSKQQLSADHDTLKLSEQPKMAQIHEPQQGIADMPPPEQVAPPKTPARRSLRSRLSNVPDVISAWFSPKRSSITVQESEKPPQVEKLAASSADAVETTRCTPRKHATGISTAHAYFTSLVSLDQHLNPSNQQSAAVDVLAVVADFTKEPERAKAGPRDYYTVFNITDPSMPDASKVRVEVFRPWKAVLPAADIGDVVLLRAFVVKSKKRQPYLLSTDSSGWCVWRFAEHSKAVRAPDRAAEDGDKPLWARSMSQGDVREEVKGPPVEYGVAEKQQAKKLREWCEMHEESHGGVADEDVGKAREDEDEGGIAL